MASPVVDERDNTAQSAVARLIIDACNGTGRRHHTRVRRGQPPVTGAAMHADCGYAPTLLLPDDGHGQGRQQPQASRRGAGRPDEATRRIRPVRACWGGEQTARYRRKTVPRTVRRQRPAHTQQAATRGSRVRASDTEPSRFHEDAAPPSSKAEQTSCRRRPATRPSRAAADPASAPPRRQYHGRRAPARVRPAALTRSGPSTW